MALVAYSDSENESSDEAAGKPTAAKSAAKSTVNPSKPAFQKVVDRSNPHKIRVTLPGSSPGQSPDGPAEEDQPAAKRARVGGGAFSGFNAMLPAPKRSGLAAPNGKSAGLGRGVNLKTGAEPAFSRAKPEDDAELDSSQAGQENLPFSDSSRETAAPQHQQSPEEEPKTTTGKATMFRPLSVARRPQKKKPATAAAAALLSNKQGDKPSNDTSTTSAPKQSLFSFGQDDSSKLDATPSVSTAEYTPILLHESSTTSAASPVEPDYTPTIPPQQIPSMTADIADDAAQSLTSIADDLQLSASAKRQLLGRQRGAGGSNSTAGSSPSAVNIINFNTDREYAANESLRAAGETVQHNPVRAIAPGKHSLKQLLTAASGQKEALEEHFATGRRNKKEAGSKYGW
ncbi:MAG: hypothetical protein M1825_005090 [Sarcosagium campestre]|nr:MAG: hypothetical protein M1825_005090 [Sarcosagium campestre]